MLKLTAKIIEPDEARMAGVLKSLSRWDVDVKRLGEQVQISFTGGENDVNTFAELMRICEVCTCTMFRLQKR